MAIAALVIVILALLGYIGWLQVHFLAYLQRLIELNKAKTLDEVIAIHQLQEPVKETEIQQPKEQELSQMSDEEFKKYINQNG